MKRLRILRNLHTSLLGVIVLAVLGAGGMVFWLNHVGLTAETREQLAAEIASKGIILEFQSLRYEPLKGLVASDVVVFADREKTLKFAHLGSVIIDVDKTKLLRKRVKVTKIEVSRGDLSMPVDPEDPQSEMLEIANFSGSVFLGKSRAVDVRNARGNINGLDLELNARLKVIEEVTEASEAKDKSMAVNARRLFSQIIKLIASYEFDPLSPPRVTFSIDGDLEQEGSIRCRTTLESSRLSMGGYTLENLHVDSLYEHGMLAINRLHASDGRGELNGRADYGLAARSGRFTFESSLDLIQALQAFAPEVKTDPLSILQPPQIQASGSFQLPHEGAGLGLRLAGNATCAELKIKDFTFTEAASDFSWQNGDLFLRDLHLSHSRGKIDGQLMVRAEDVRFHFQSSLPAEIFEPFFTGKTLGKVLAKFTMTENSRVALDLEGTVSRADPHQWACWGQGEAFNLAFAGVPAKRAKTTFALNTLELRFEQIEADFDYTEYALRLAHQGPETGAVTAERIVYDMSSHLLNLDNIRGHAWPAPVLRLFSVPLADKLEVYRFHAPPKIQATGVVGFFDATAATDFTTRFETDSNANYHFAGAELTLADPRGTVRVHNGGVDISGLKFGVFGGSVDAQLGFPRGGDPARFTSEFSCKRIPLNEVVHAWGTAKKDRPPLQGYFTGRTELAGAIGKPATFNGRGLLALEDGELFSVPVFGPLSPLIGNILGDKAGFQRAKDAFFTFHVQNGILRTNDFQTSTPSLVLTGDGTLTLADRQLDFIMRMNARGFLGLITLPLRPFYGLFQFRGTGPLADPQWDNVRFTKPANGNANPIFRDPPKARIVAE